MINNQTLIGIDYGSSNIGVALGKNGLVSPIKVISGKDTNTAINDLARIAIENKAERFVLGLPLTADGKETKESLIIRKFAKLLKIYTRKPLDFYSEFGSSQESLVEAIDLGISQKKRRVNDHLSAAIILRRYFEEKV